MDITKGTRGKLEQYVNPQQKISIIMKTEGPAVYDYACLGVDTNGKLSDDRYMVFYNQPASPNREIVWNQSRSENIFDLELSRLPSVINKLVFTVSIDGSGTMGNISSHSVSIRQNGSDAVRLNLKRNDFHQEKAIISLEVYKKDVWRFNAVASGFNGGLDDLLRAYGGEVIEETTSPAPTIAPASTSSYIPPAPHRSTESTVSSPVEVRPQRVSLEKKLEKEAPALVSLAKPLKVELEKRKLLDCVARVVLVLDISGSMRGQYANGTVQEIVNKILPIAVQFDDDGELDLWYYGSKPKRMSPISLKNYKSAVPRKWSSLMESLGYGNNEVVIMEKLRDEYRDSNLPVYVVFITDGGIGCDDCTEEEIKYQLIDASKEPIFWQFVGVGGSGYGILQDLDTMNGRYIDNANFFALDDFRSVSNSELYGRVLNEFPQWLKEAARMGVFDGRCRMYPECEGGGSSENSFKSIKSFLSRFFD